MKKLVLILALAGLICFPALAGADTVTYTTTTPIALTATNWASSLTFPKFDSSLGTLTSIDLFLTTGSNGLDTQFTVSTLTYVTSGNAKTEVTLTVTDPFSLISAVLDKFVPTTGFAFNIPPDSNPVTSAIYRSSANDTFTYTDGLVLAEFTGTGSISLPANAATFTWASWGGGNADVSQSTHAALTGNITYTYTPFPIPIPPSALLLGSGLLGLAFLGRRKIGLKK